MFLTSTINGRVLISTLASLVGIPVGITSSVATTKVFVITAGIKKKVNYQKKEKET